MTEIDRQRVRDTDKMLPRDQVKAARDTHGRVAGGVPGGMFGESQAGRYLEKLLGVHNSLFHDITGAASDGLENFGRAFVKVADNVDRAEEEAEREYRKVEASNSQIDSARQRARDSEANRSAQEAGSSLNTQTRGPGQGGGAGPGTGLAPDPNGGRR